MGAPLPEVPCDIDAQTIVMLSFTNESSYLFPLKSCMGVLEEAMVRAITLRNVIVCTLGGVDQEHTTGLQPPLGDNPLRRDVDMPQQQRHHALPYAAKANDDEPASEGGMFGVGHGASGSQDVEMP